MQIMRFTHRCSCLALIACLRKHMMFICNFPITPNWKRINDRKLRLGPSRSLSTAQPVCSRS
jgi:hypothetical protein